MTKIKINKASILLVFLSLVGIYLLYYYYDNFNFGTNNKIENIQTSLHNDNEKMKIQKLVIENQIEANSLKFQALELEKQNRDLQGLK